MKMLYRVLVYPNCGHHVIAGLTGHLAIDCESLTGKQARTLVEACMFQGDHYVEVFGGNELLFEGCASEWLKIT
jgi:hypothetical protein